jgi:hypothetical protein
MTCKHTEKISLLIDGELLAAEAIEIERHLVACNACQQAREDFLNLRSRIVAYRPALDPAVSERALAEILSHNRVPGATPATTPPSWREQVFTAFSANRFNLLNPRFAAVAALFVVAFTIGGIALLRSRSHTYVASSDSTPDARIANSNPINPRPKTDITEPFASSSPVLEVATNRKPKAPRGGSREGRRTRQSDKDPRPTPVRNTPVPQPQPRYDPNANYAAITDPVVTPGAGPVENFAPESLTAKHLEHSELLLRAFRNIRIRTTAPEIRYERGRAQRLLYQNILLRREADSAGDVQVATLLGSLEPILLDIANLRDKPRKEEVSAIKDRVERKSLVALLQINSTAIARAYE